MLKGVFEISAAFNGCWMHPRRKLCEKEFSDMFEKVKKGRKG